jgi:hypothetical protein
LGETPTTKGGLSQNGSANAYVDVGTKLGVVVLRDRPGP